MSLLYLLKRDAGMAVLVLCHKAPNLVLALEHLAACLPIGIERGEVLPELLHGAIEEGLGHEEFGLDILLIDAIAGLAGEDDKFAEHVLAREVYARVGLAISLGLGQFHGLAEGNVGRDGVEDIVESTAEHGLDAKDLVARVAKVVDGADDGKPGTHVGLEEELHATHLCYALEFAILLVIAGGRYLVGRHDVDVVREEVLVERSHIGRGGAIHEDTVEDVHADDLVAKTLEVALGRLLQLLAEVLQIQSLAGKHGIVARGNAHDIELEAEFAHELLALLMYLLYKAAAHGAHTADEEVEHLVFAQKKGVVDYVQRLAQILLSNDKGDIRLAGTLGTGNNADTATAKRAEQLAGNARCVLHVLAHYGHGGQASLGHHGIHGALGYLLGKLFVEHTACLLGIGIAHTDGGAVLTACLRYHEHGDAIVCQTGEDTAVHTDDTHHGETADGDERGALDAGDATDGLLAQVDILLDDGARSLGVEGILDPDGYVLDANGIDGGGIYHLGTEVAEFHGLGVGEFVDDVCRADDTGVSGHETVHIGPYLQGSGIQCGRYDGGGVVATATAKVGNLAALYVGGDETAHQAYLGQALPGVAHNLVGGLCGKHVLAVLLLGADNVARVKPTCTLYHRGHDAGRHALAITDDGSLGLLREVADKEHTLVDAAQFLEQGTHYGEQFATGRTGRESLADDLLMTANDFQENLLVSLVALLGHVGRLYQLVGNATQGTDHHDDGLRLRLHYLLYVKYAFCATHTGTAKFQYFHTYICILSFRAPKVRIITAPNKHFALIFTISLSFCLILHRHFGTTFAIYTCRDDTAGITGTLATGEETTDAHVLEGLPLTQNAHRGRGAGFDGYHVGLVGEEAMVGTAKGLETLLQTGGDELGHPEVQRTGNETGGIGAFVEVSTETVVDKVGHALSRGRLLAVALKPAMALQLLLKQEGTEYVVLHVSGIYAIAHSL